MTLTSLKEKEIQKIILKLFLFVLTDIVNLTSFLKQLKNYYITMVFLKRDNLKKKP